MNPYKVLEVSDKASFDDIRKSYRRLARKYHPDANPGDKNAEEKFKEINDAYTILSDESKRAEYDRKESSAKMNKKSNEKKKNPFGGNPFGQSPFMRTPFGEDFFERDENVEETKTDFGFGVDKESINNQFANFFGFNTKR
ncbi:MAG: DnaJ domain-containing protein [Lachnospiraceae bacterium]|nr:DnaJ domain-containing protein [Lachnospiraceae bacterium]MDE6253201.1 DnaJ domain-containing protein [Lachnospiraceae bacterium]